ncbi:MAG: ABC transporter permease [Deltaproteobacteria bacterium]|jgi:ABC-2 type transport system permease protein|nr:ABC transporter permease [Deltaproteobacteria bacterium]
MNRICTVAAKELLLLRRDLGGMLVLFLMPAVLVLIITLVQQNVMELTGEQRSRLLFIDEEQGDLGRAFQAALAEDSFLEIHSWPPQRRKEALSAVQDGAYTACLILPAGTGKALRTNLEESLEDQSSAAEEGADPLPHLTVYFDPAMLPAFRSGVLGKVKMAFGRVEMAEKIDFIGTHLIRKLSDLGIPEAYLSEQELGLAGLNRHLLEVREQGEAISEVQPGVVQQNVPAWALFGIFFTVLPLGGALLRERQSGVWTRFMSMPFSPFVLLCGKVVAYLLVCFLQFLLIYAIGNQLFPLLGLPAFSIAAAPAQVLFIACAASLAACGYGLLLGVVCNSYEQVSMFGSISIVISAAMGGIMVPVYAMPAALQRLSVFSPLNWGLTAFHDVLIRDDSLWSTESGIFRLLLFFLCSIGLAWKMARPKW